MATKANTTKLVQHTRNTRTFYISFILNTLQICKTQTNRKYPEMFQAVAALCLLAQLEYIFPAPSILYKVYRFLAGSLYRVSAAARLLLMLFSFFISPAANNYNISYWQSSSHIIIAYFPYTYTYICIYCRKQHIILCCCCCCKPCAACRVPRAARSNPQELPQSCCLNIHMQIALEDLLA